MGTSSIFGGKKDKSRLLPTDYNSNKRKNGITWKGLKTEISRLVSSNGHYSNSKRIVSNYIKASGGASSLAQKSKSGIRTLGNLVNFFYELRQEGIVITLHKLGIDFLGQSVSNIFSKLVEVFAESANSKESVVARMAVQEALVNLYNYVEHNNMDIESLDKMPLELMNNVLKNFITEYIRATILKDLESRIEDKMPDVTSAKQRESEIKDIIESVVSIEFDDNKDFINKNLRNAVKELLQKCYEVLEGII